MYQIVVCEIDLFSEKITHNLQGYKCDSVEETDGKLRIFKWIDHTLEPVAIYAPGSWAYVKFLYDKE